VIIPHRRGETDEADAINRPYFSTSVITLRSSKSGFALAGGILTILSSLGCSLLGLIFLILGFAANWGESPNTPLYSDYWSLFIGILGFIAFALGLAGGIMALIRRNFALAIIGPFLIVSEVLAITIYMRASGVFGVLLILLFAIPPLLGLIFVAIAKQEFR
jgi:hypothetical protein